MYICAIWKKVYVNYIQSFIYSGVVIVDIRFKFVDFEDI